MCCAPAPGTGVGVGVGLGVALGVGVGLGVAEGLGVAVGVGVGVGVGGGPTGTLKLQTVLAPAAEDHTAHVSSLVTPVCPVRKPKLLPSVCSAPPGGVT